MRAFLAIFGCLALSALIAGCAATEPGQRFASRSLFKKPAADAKPDGAAKPDAKEAVAATDKKATEKKSENPFRKTASAAKTTEKETKTETAANDKPASLATAAADKPPAKPEAKPAAGEFNVETMKLIDEKLSDASPEERAYWYEQLKRVDPAVIPQILEARRLTADIVERRQTDVSESKKESADRGRPFPKDDAVRQVSATSLSQEADARQRPFAEPPLGANPGAANPQAAMTPEKSQFAVQKVTGAEAAKTPAVSSGSSLLPSLSAPRNALNRLLPNGRTSTATTSEPAATSSSAVSLMRPTELDDAVNWPQQLSLLISQAEAEVAALKPGTTEETQTDYIRRHVFLRMLYLMADHPERALTAIPGIDSADQEFWQQTLWAMTNYFDVDHLPTAKDRAGQAVAQLAAATQRLRERSNLEIHNLSFCSEITHFGNFLRFPRDEFHPGERVLLYAEIENFKSELTIDGAYRTLIRSSMEILSPSGEVRWQEEFPAEEDLCTSYRRDYFHNYTLTIPDRLPMGPHTLKLTVFDELSGKMVSQSVNFVVR